ncbi:MAG TPA: CHAT domain-containing protein [Blastocatellia bacterium]|nr:CHAT domain-containing protein [Blastocatellia bacterium]
MSATRRVPSAIKSQRIFIPWKLVGFLLAGLAALGLGLRFVPLRPLFGTSQGMPALIKAFGEERPIELRPSGGFRAGTYLPKAADQGRVNKDRLETARRLILEQANNSDDLHSKLGYVRLALYERTSAKAQEHLNELVRRFPHSAEVRNDMGVCRFEEPNIEEAIANFDEAIRIDPGMPEPLFNRAVCYQKLHLVDAATRDFHRLKEIEKDAGWLGEIDARIEEVESLLKPPHQEKEAVVSLEEAVNAGDIDRANDILDHSFEGLWRYSQVFLPQDYMKARLKNDSESSAALVTRMDTMSRLIEERKGDSFLREFYAYLRNVPDSEVEAELKLLMDYWDATVRASNHDPSSLEPLNKVSEDCRKRGNVHLMILADFSRTIALSLRNKFQASIDLLQHLISTLDQQKWQLQRSKILLQLAVAYADRGQLSLVINLCGNEMESLKERPRLQGKALQLLGTAYWKLGNFDTALGYLRKSSDTYMAVSLDPTILGEIYDNIAYNQLTIADIYYGYRNHSLAYQNVDQSLRFFSLTGGKHFLAEALALKATEEANLGMDGAAEKTMGEALKVLSNLSPDLKEYSEKLVLIRAGEVALHRKDFGRALGYFSSSVDRATKDKGDDTLTIRALRGLSEAAYRMGDAEKARLSLKQAIPLLERYRNRIQESGNRISYLSAVQSIFDQRVLLELNSFNDSTAAFNYAELCRARSLLDDIYARQHKDSPPKPAASTAQMTKPLPSRPTVKPLDLEGIQSRLPANYVVLMYIMTAEDTFAFVIDRKNLRWKKLRAGSDEIDRDVKEYVAEVRKEGDLYYINNKAAKLYRDLMEPVREWIPNGSVLCVVPDKSLNLMPMAALVDSDGRYLLESFTLTNAASASVLIESLRMAAKNPAPEDESLLMVANASYSREDFPNLRDISDSETEAVATKPLYSPASLTLLKGEATEQRVQAAIKDFDVVHFALHVLVEEDSPGLAALVLAPPEWKQSGNRPGAAGGDGKSPARGLYPAPSKEVFNDPEDGLLYLSEVYNFGLTRTRLVILSGCESGLGQYYRGEGMVSMVMPFLASNVPTVMASLWAVNSQATSSLMIDFHEKRKNGHPGAASALRAAQLNMLRGPALYRHPYYWAPFIVVGGNN